MTQDVILPMDSAVKFSSDCPETRPESCETQHLLYSRHVAVNFCRDKLILHLKNSVVAANKVSIKVRAVDFSEDCDVHIKFWYLDHSKSNKGLHVFVKAH
ncbi:hypothetical protein UPYG_G00348060 [Umbra pygmaea]|uniref:Uncharacterized protein n=1 Tax=Umbra pygmaea TaxID=75934 RepID=A0ABD0W2A1_UMBPY